MGALRRFALSVVGVLSLAAGAQAALYSFGGVTNTSAVNTMTGQNQLQLEVLANGSLVDFFIRNLGPLQSVVAQIFFDDNALLSFNSIGNGAGVSFHQGASPGNLPGGANINFNTTSGLAFGANNPAPQNGVNPGESVRITMALLGGQTFADVLSDIANGELRLGLHVTSFANGGSESFVNNPPRVVPAPAAVVLGLVGLGLVKRFQRHVA